MNGIGDKRRFAALMYWLAGRMLAPGGRPRQVDDHLLADYHQALADCRIERLEWAARHIFATEKWFPMPVELRAAAMLAPSGVLPPPPGRPGIAEITGEQAEENRRHLGRMVAWFEEEVEGKGVKGGLDYRTHGTNGSYGNHGNHGNHGTNGKA